MFLRVGATWIALTRVYSGQHRTFDYPYGWGVDHISWDSSTITKQELMQWMQLSPVVSRGNGFLVPEDIALCIAGDSRYQNCAQQDSNSRSFEFSNAQVNLGIIRARLAMLEKTDYPQDLSPVVDYFKAVQTVALQRGTHELSYFKTGDIAALEERLDTVDPAVACKEEIGQIRSAQDKKEQAKLVRFDWENCLWHAAQKQIGPYPEEAWKNFLAAQGITEVNEEGTDDNDPGP